MNVMNRLSGSQTPSLSHPSVPDRIAKLKALQKTLPPAALVKEGRAKLAQSPQPLRLGVSRDDKSLRIESRFGGKAPYLDLTDELVPSPSQRPFYLFALDATPNARPSASTLEDRSFVHAPNPISTNKPITIGHEYSIVSALPEATQTQGVPWTIPLMAQHLGLGNVIKPLMDALHQPG